MHVGVEDQFTASPPVLFERLLACKLVCSLLPYIVDLNKIHAGVGPPPPLLCTASLIIFEFLAPVFSVVSLKLYKAHGKRRHIIGYSPSIGLKATTFLGFFLFVRFPA